MISEAKVRNGESGNVELNEVRARAGASTDVVANLETLLAERLREFAWEGLRRQDLVRLVSLHVPTLTDLNYRVKLTDILPCFLSMKMF